MKITEFSIRNPLVVGGLAVALCLFGLFAYFRLGVATMPNLNLPSVSVTTFYPGADPETVETNVTKVIEADVDAFWGIGTVVISGKQPLVRLQDVAENLVQPKFNAVPGVSSTSIRSGVTREIHVLVDEDKLRSRGLTISQVVGALQSQQLEVPAGTITQGTRDFNVYFASLATSMSSLGEIVVQQTPGG